MTTPGANTSPGDAAESNEQEKKQSSSLSK
jgi:hypothetical protein